MLSRIWPLFLQQSPLDVFSLLFLGHGFSAAELASTAPTAWTRLQRHPPLSKLKWGMNGRYTVTSLFEDDTSPDLGITQAGGRLELGAAADERLRMYLASRSMRAFGENVSGADAWPLYGSGGRAGSLVVVLCKGAQPAELSDLTPTPAQRTPLVAVTVVGSWWELPIVRGLCQMLAGLGDEYELPGPEFERAPEALADWSLPNVLIVSAEQRAKLAAGTDPKDVIPGLIDRLPVHFLEDVTFRPHQGADPNPTPPQPATGRVQLIEGGQGYRFNALRTDFDCLMRRRPGDPTLRVQADVGLCRTCRDAVDRAITSPADLPVTRRVLLRNQRPLFDEVRWPSVESVRQFPFHRALTHGAPDPRWSCTVDVTAQDGLRITGIQLANRPDDPFTTATDVLSLIEFKALEIEFEGGRKESLPASKAFVIQRGLPAPTLEIAFDGGARQEFRVGMKLTAWFLVADTCAVEATYSLVLKHMASDIDPGGTVLACKLYPQLALRHVRAPVLPDPPPDELPAVVALRGTISVHCNNVVPESMHDALAAVDEHLGHMANGRNAVTVITDSNRGPFDATYNYVGPPGPPDPTELLGQSERHWLSGRKLGGVELFDDPKTVAATVLTFAMRGWVPILPHWSWLFDYATPSIETTKQFVGAYATDDITGGGSLAREVRVTGAQSVAWPPASLQSPPPRAYVLAVRKLPRQGAYDNVHIALDMGTDTAGRHVVSAPFCADKCLHIHWRWGTIASSGAAIPYAFHGWGDGRLDAGAHAVPGAPLIPPNQRLDVRVAKEGGALASVDYTVTAAQPGRGHVQVFLEQGISFAFGYSGLGLYRVGLLATALNLWPFSPTSLGIRRLFHRVYPVIRWFGTNEGVTSNTVQQVPGPPTSTESLPLLESL